MTEFVTWVAVYFYALKWIFIVVACAILICGLDDLFIDLYYWRLKFGKGVRRFRKPGQTPSEKTLLHQRQKPLAIMVPAWQEVGVVGGMAQLMAEKLDYENYHIFIGTYPNDPATQADVDNVCALYPNVHKVVCVNPGPTCKADCLNNILRAISQFERDARVEFSGYILHDAEDVIHPLELRLFNHYLPKYGLIQLPVYPFVRVWHKFTSGHYTDEFSELHGKDVLVREAITGQVPSAGVGTCFSRKAVDKLFQKNRSTAFNTESLTEDYDIGFQLKRLGLRETFVRCPTDTSATQGGDNLGWSQRERSVVCVREYFPDRLSAAIRQKSRWIVGIVFQGFKSIGWTDNWRINYFLLRDRRSLVTNLLGFMGLLILINLVALLVYQNLNPDGYKFLANFASDKLVAVLVLCNLLLLANRFLQRFIFVSQYYGFTQGMLSIPRVIWGNVINFFACARAIRQTFAVQSVRSVAWDKTTHDFPLVKSARKSEEDLLIQFPNYESTWLKEGSLKTQKGLGLFQRLILGGKVTAWDVATIKARAAGVDPIELDPYVLDEAVLRSFPKYLVWKYSVVPIAQGKNGLTLASEDPLSPVSLAALTRSVGNSIEYVIAAPGTVVAAMKYWYGGKTPEMSRDTSVGYGPNARSPLTQVLLKDYMVRTGVVSQPVMTQLLVELSEKCWRIEDLLTGKGILSPEQLEAMESEVRALEEMQRMPEVVTFSSVRVREPYSPKVKFSQ